MERVTKLSKVQAHMEKGEWRQALAIAARFPQLGKEAEAIKLGHEAWAHPDFYKQIGKDVEQLRKAGADARVQKYGPRPAKKTAAKAAPKGYPPSSATPPNKRKPYP